MFIFAPIFQIQHQCWAYSINFMLQNLYFSESTDPDASTKPGWGVVKQKMWLTDFFHRILPQNDTRI